MAELKLSRLPDRTAIRITISLSPELNTALADYGEAYAAAYGEREPIAELIPFMLASFLKSDRGFSRTRKRRE